MDHATTGIQPKITKKRIGLLYPSSGVSEYEIEKMLPDRVSLHVTRIPMSMPTYEVALHMADTVKEASRLLADAKVDLIAFGCTVGSFIKGRGYEREIVDSITQATGLPATTTTTAVVAALMALGVEKLVVVVPTPFVELPEMERTFLEDSGFQVLRLIAPSVADCVQEYCLEPTYWYRLVKENQEPQADGYFVSCGGIRVVDIIEQAETDLGKPVVTSNQALVWHCLRKIGLQEPVEGFGRLMKTSL